jgi:hypothetical protein
MKVCNWNVRLIHAVIAICCLVVFAAGSAQAQQTISFPDFSSTANLQINGNAAVVPTNVLRLTPNRFGQVGSAWYTNSLSLAQGFSTTFTFKLANQGDGSIGAADGIAFVIQNGSFSGNGTSGRFAIGPVATASGGGIGFQGLTNSVAIEFDTFCNGTDSNSDTCVANSFSSANEVGILSCGASPNSANHASPTAPLNPGCGIAQANATTSILADTTVHTAVITYTPPPCECSNLTVTLDDHLVLSASFDLASLGLSDANDNAFVGFTAATGAGFENQDILSWSFTATQSQQTGQTTNPDSAANLAQQFVFNNTAGNQVEFDFDYTPSFHAGTVIVANNTVPRVSDDAVTPSDYQTMVMGTALAETTCFTSNGQLALGNAACPKLTIQCKTDTNSTFAGDNCPQSTQRNLFFKHVIDVVGGGNLGTGGEPVIPAGSAPTLAMGSDDWSPTNGCTLAGPEEGQLCPKSIETAFLDCCKSPGTTKGSNSAFIGGCCEREWTTTPMIPLYSNSTSVPVSFTSVPPSIPVVNPNNWVAAPGQSVTFGFEAPGAAPDPTFPVLHDQTLLNPSLNTSAPCGSSTTPMKWTPGTNPPSFATSGNVMVGGEGAYELHFFSTDCDEMQELIYAPNGTNNWAKFKTTPFNVDLTKPTVTGPTLSTTTPLPGQQVMATYSCADPISNGVASGIATCGPHTSAGPFTDTFTVPTNAQGPQTFSVTATDRAGNSTPASVGYSVNYDFDGFFFPVANAPTVNTIDERSVVPLIFQTERFGDTGVNGLKLVPSGSASITGTNSAACSLPHVLVSPIVIKSFFNTGLIGLGNGFYVFAWQVNLPRNACIDLSLNLGDGVLHHAIFQTR